MNFDTEGQMYVTKSHSGESNQPEIYGVDASHLVVFYMLYIMPYYQSHETNEHAAQRDDRHQWVAATT